uniref:Mitochondrial import inner membrane translocase subunit TIM50 n=1 Tax=Neobodo designis TaxID=312471 RepID=A0A7S1VZ51_NEODS
MLSTRRRHARDNRVVVHTLASGDRGGPAVIARESFDAVVTDAIRVCAGHGVSGGKGGAAGGGDRTPRAAPSRIRRLGGTTRTLSTTTSSRDLTSATQSPRRGPAGHIDVSALLRLCGRQLACDDGDDSSDDDSDFDTSSSCSSSDVSTDSDAVSVLTTSSCCTASTSRHTSTARRRGAANSASKAKPKRQRGRRAGKKNRSSRLPSAAASCHPSRAGSEGSSDELPPAASLMSAGQERLGHNHDGLILLAPPRTQPRLTVVLDLDETLVRLREGPVYVRPHAKLLFETLKAIGGIEVIIWTCATDKYARYALSHVPSAFFHHIVSRDARWYEDGTPAVKNLRWLGRDLDRCLHIDNCPVAVSANPDNCIVVQDIPECLPLVDETLRHVSEAIAHVIAAHEPVPKALASCPFVSISVLVAADDDGDDSGLATPATSPTSGSTAQNGAFPDTTTSGTDESETSGSASLPPYISAWSLDYTIPGVVTTYGAREQPAKREQHMPGKGANNSHGGARVHHRR